MIFYPDVKPRRHPKFPVCVYTSKMDTTAPQLKHSILTRRNLIFLALAILLHLLALHGLDIESIPAKAKMQENPIAVQFRDIPDDHVKQTEGSINVKPGPVATPEPKKLRRLAPVQAIPDTVVPEPVVEQAVNPPINPALNPVEPVPVAVEASKEENKAQEATGVIAKDNISSEGPQTYPVRPPQTGKISMRIVRTEANRNPVYGDGEINWEFKTGRYKMSIEASLDLLLTSINLYQLHSEGNIDVYGVTPAISTEKRRSRSETATHFDHANKAVSFSSSNKTSEVQSGVQDKASFIMQLAGIGNAEPDKFQPGREIRLQVAEERDVSTFVFVVTALEEVETKMGKIMAWHVIRPPLPGSYNSKLEVWLAPEQNWYPIQIRNTESNGAVTTQTATKIISIPNLER